MELPLESKIEGLLFYKGEDVSIKELGIIFGITREEVEQGLEKLEVSLAGRGLVIVRRDDRVVMGISAGLFPIIESIRKDEITKELSKAALETLSIVLYKNGVSRAEIDYIRGVNSSFILRNLLIRGLVERVLDAKDSRKVIYKPTFDTLSYMGVTSIDQLPNYTETVTQLEETLNQDQKND
jgi:segregation and condensation protein B